MLFSDRPRVHYQRSMLHEVICQLRFPTILSINNVEPADFQEAIREAFPQYVRRQETPPPRITAVPGGAPKAEPQPPISNYHFLSEDNAWKLNLTRDFIALSTLRYTSWEDFARHLDQPLAAFIRIYKPAYFQRVGLRYVNLFSRQKLDLEDHAWNELFASAYVSAMSEPDVQPENVISCVTNLELKLDSSCCAKIKAAPATMKGGKQPNGETKFVFDMDLSMSGNVPCTLSAAALETLHGHAGRIFEGAITDTLRSVMKPR